MNIIQKHKSKIAKVYLNKEDQDVQISKVGNNLIDFLSLTPADYSIYIHITNMDDFTMEFLGLLMSFIKTANERDTSLTLFLNSKLADLILNLGTGNLKYSMELIGDTI